MKKWKVMLLCLFLTACTQSDIPITNSTNNNESSVYTFNEEDFYTDYLDAILLDSTSSTINSPGTYELKGSYTNIEVNVGENDTVRLVLNNTTINGEINIKQAKKVVISLPEGTINTITSAQEDGINSNSSLVLNGEGTLKVESTTKDGIQSSEEIIIIGGQYDIVALDKGFDSDRHIAIYDGSFNITTTEGDGIHVTSETNEGLIYLQNGSYTIKGQRDGISCDGNLTIVNGTYDITTEQLAEEESQKGFKSTTTMEINGGTFTFNTIDDSIHSNGNLTINDINTTMTTQKKAIHADGTLLIKDGTIQALSCDEGLEAKILQIDGGTITIIASDDGFNADDKASTIEMGAQEGVDIIINGGTITIQAGGDGIDSNNTLHINGGKTYVYSNGQADSAIDYESEMQITGGQFIACGPSGMAVTPSHTSTQPFVMAMTNSQEKVKLTDGDNTLLEWDVPSSYSHIILSHPDLVQDEIYTIYCGEITQTVTATTEGMTQQMFPGGRGEQRPEGFNQWQMPEGFDESQLPEDFDPNQIPENGQGGGRFPQQSENRTPPEMPNGSNPPTDSQFENLPTN